MHLLDVPLELGTADLRYLEERVCVWGGSFRGLSLLSEWQQKWNLPVGKGFSRAGHRTRVDLRSPDRGAAGGDDLPPAAKPSRSRFDEHLAHILPSLPRFMVPLARSRQPLSGH